MATLSPQVPVLSALPQDKTCGIPSSSCQSNREACAVPYGVRVLQNGRPVLEDAFSHAVLELEAASCAGGASSNSSTTAAAAAAAHDHPPPVSFFGVFDGHGGAEVAHHAAAKLHQHFQAAYKQLASSAAQLAASGSACSNTSSCATMEEALCEAWHSNSSSDNSSGGPASFADVLAAAAAGSGSAQAQDLSCSSPCSTASDSSGGSAGGGSGSPTSQQVWASINAGRMRHEQQQQRPSKASQRVVQALREAFLRTDAELEGTEVGEVVGTTAVTAVLGREEIFIGHCGDSRAVLCRKGVAVPLTNDHKPGRADEMARVSSLGGKVVYKAGSHRVMGLLAMSRALGDHFLRPYVIPEPEVLCLQRCPDDEILILATDGLWDVFSCQEATTLALRSTIRARQRGASAAAACRVGASVLVRGAIERGSRDNITCCVVDLRRRSESIASVASVLASQCSTDMSCFIGGGGAGGGSTRKRRSNSGDNNDSDGSEYLDLPQQHQHQQPLAHHSSICTGSAFKGTLRSSTAAAAAGDPNSYNRRHTSSNCDTSSGGGAGGSGNSGSTGDGGLGSSSSSRGPGVTWGWNLQGLHILPHSQDNPTTSIRALAQAAAAAVAAFSGTLSVRSSSGIPHQRDVAASVVVASAAAGGSSQQPSTAGAAPAAAPAAVAGAGAGGGGAAVTQQGVTAPTTPTLADLLSMQSAPALRHAGGGGAPARTSSSAAGKPPLPQPARGGV